MERIFGERSWRYSATIITTGFLGLTGTPSRERAGAATLSYVTLHFTPSTLDEAFTDIVRLWQTIATLVRVPTTLQEAPGFAAVAANTPGEHVAALATGDMVRELRQYWSASGVSSCSRSLKLSLQQRPLLMNMVTSPTILPWKSRSQWTCGPSCRCCFGVWQEG